MFVISFSQCTNGFFGVEYRADCLVLDLICRTDMIKPNMRSMRDRRQANVIKNCNEDVVHSDRSDA